MIKSVGENKYAVFNHAGEKQLSKPESKKQAVLRLKQIEYFKHKGDE